ncbi:response regulator [Bradyrhizobium sp. SSBR45G]|uniref:response regulator n=1 Tax=unclassified Bradyrhizobium TaxID=2631580 RepID=UPI0023428D53|nr:MULTISPECIES: response regulator [unclassified Bradyrhizobium]GLH76677.1 response regulator [Bradyrhizobium sp. SSBR45G]GLH84290.1 response regulator [Bradyrhizobium sp. SSBR45R]
MTDAAKKQILVVDDAALVRTYYRAALEARGFKVEEALNGLEGLEKILLQSFDLAIVDVNMPQMDGITFVRTVRAMELPVSSTPILMISTEAGPQDIAAARQAGANYYLVKPIKQDTLAEFAAIFCGAH